MHKKTRLAQKKLLIRSDYLHCYLVYKVGRQSPTLKESIPTQDAIYRAKYQNLFLREIYL